MTNRFEEHTLEQNTQSLANTLPNGGTFIAKNIDQSNLRNLLVGLSGEIFRIESLLVDLTEEYYIPQTTLLIEEWERALGIPDGCFNAQGSIEERRIHCIAKFLAAGTQTGADFIAVAALFGKTVTIIDDPSEPYVIKIEGPELVTNVPPYNVPFSLDSGETILECFLNKLKPANCTIEFINT